MEDGGGDQCITDFLFYSFSLTLFSHSSMSPSQSLQPFRMNLLCRAWVIHGLQRTTALELGASFLDPGAATLLFHLILLPPPISLLYYLLSFECASSAAPLILQRTISSPGGLTSGTLNLLERWLEVAVTGTGQPLASSYNLLTTKTLSYKPNTHLTIPVTTGTPLSGDMRF